MNLVKYVCRSRAPSIMAKKMLLEDFLYEFSIGFRWLLLFFVCAFFLLLQKIHLLAVTPFFNSSYKVGECVVKATFSYLKIAQY